MITIAGALRDRAINAAQAGDQARAGELFDEAVAAAPSDASILNSAGAHWSKVGDADRARELFGRAVIADGAATEPLINLAILLTNGGRAPEALALLAEREQSLSGNARYWSVRANAERAAGHKRDGLASFERGWALDRSNPRTAQGRARLALETGLDARDRYRDALAASPGDPVTILGWGQALEAAGDAVAARAVADHLVAQLPQWTPGLEWLAQLRWAAGESDSFCAHYLDAASRAKSAEIYASWCRMLAGVDQFAAAAEVARVARREVGDSPQFALLEAIHAGEAGDDQRAAAIFEGLELESPERKLHEARHWLRTQSPDRAELLLAELIDQNADNVAAWALRDIAWRLLGDARHEWLHGQEGLVRGMHLDLDDDQLASVIALLDELHDVSSMPVGQSVRQGSQTRGGLFDRHEPEIAILEDSFRRAVQGYRDQLPPRDERHPLLRHRDASWRFAGSWSIRVLSGGRHTEHIHPLGLVSSAAYFVVPTDDDDDDQGGWLELGRPPPDLRLDLPPLYAIEPRVRQCALFPSTLYHGTRKFSAGKRMTVAIDIHLDAAS